ncbi:uncharacterized protein LOC113523868 [Pangasianodon hypophthalmus]|uniref:uncharacterized protein LOC113523868 n=1 Tax=Pangasianodon hypophthalmus TaxID=310915 RepID=UPI002307F414|nr:uncharacterized protein LOC113523868 [Pangasianodon hypophthalmus]XP_053097710.1 uncharacterized protein LOC113523868 [Pangasianodon hypophthalmus]
MTQMLPNAAEVSDSETPVSPIISNFLERLTDQQLHVMREATSDPLTREEMHKILKKVVKTVTEMALKIIIPNMDEILNVDPSFPCSSEPGSSHQSVLSPSNRHELKDTVDSGSHSTLTKDEDLEIDSEPVDVLLEITEDNIPLRDDESQQQSVSGLHSGWSSNSSSELNAAVVKEEFQEIISGASNMALSSDTGSPSPPFHILPKSKGTNSVTKVVTNANMALSSDSGSQSPPFHILPKSNSTNSVLVTKAVMNAIVSTMTNRLDEKEDLRILQLLTSVARKLEVLSSASSSETLFKSESESDSSDSHPLNTHTLSSKNFQIRASKAVNDILIKTTNNLDPKDDLHSNVLADDLSTASNSMVKTFVNEITAAAQELIQTSQSGDLTTDKPSAKPSKSSTTAQDDSNRLLSAVRRIYGSMQNKVVKSFSQLLAQPSTKTVKVLTSTRSSPSPPNEVAQASQSDSHILAASRLNAFKPWKTLSDSLQRLVTLNVNREQIQQCTKDILQEIITVYISEEHKTKEKEEIATEKYSFKATQSRSYVSLVAERVVDDMLFSLVQFKWPDGSSGSGSDADDNFSDLETNVLTTSTEENISAIQKISSEEFRTEASRLVSEVFSQSIVIADADIPEADLDTTALKIVEEFVTDIRDLLGNIAQSPQLAADICENSFSGSLPSSEDIHVLHSLEQTDSGSSKGSTESRPNISEVDLWSFVHNLYDSVMSQVSEFLFKHQQREAEVRKVVANVFLAIDEQLQSSQEAQHARNVIGSMQKNVGVDKPPSAHTLKSIEPERLCSTASSRTLVSKDNNLNWNEVTNPVTPYPSLSSLGKRSPCLKSSLRSLDKEVRPKTRSSDVVSMTTLVDTLMASLDLEHAEHFSSLENLFAAANRSGEMNSKGAPHKFTLKFVDMIQQLIKRRMTPIKSVSDSAVETRRRQVNTDMQQSLAYEFLCEFAEESVKRLLTSCILPPPTPARTQELPTMPFVTPENFDFSRPLSEVYADATELLSNIVWKQVMEHLSVSFDQCVDEIFSIYSEDLRSIEDQKLDTTASCSELHPAPQQSMETISNAEKTPEVASYSCEKAKTFSLTALCHCVRTILLRIQQESSAEVSPFLYETSDEVQLITIAVLDVLKGCRGVKLKDDEHEPKELQSRLIDTVYTQVLQRIGSQSDLFEALKSQSPELTGSLAVSIVRTLQSMNPEDIYITSSHSRSPANDTEEHLEFSQAINDQGPSAVEIKKELFLKHPKLKNLFKKLRKGKTGSSDSLDQEQHCSTDADMSSNIANSKRRSGGSGPSFPS